MADFEDSDDPVNGSSTGSELRPSDSWQTYEINLGEFETAQLSVLALPLGFVFLE